MIQHLDNWLEQHRRQVWEAIYLVDRETCEEALQRAERAVQTALFPEDDTQALQIYLGFLRHQLRNHFADSSQSGADLARSEIVSVNMADRGPFSKLMQTRCSLTQRSWAHALHGIVLPLAQVDKWYGEIPEEDRDHQLMNYLSFWSFVNDNLYYLDQSYRYFLLQPVEFMVDFSRQRVKVMQAVVRDDLERSDLHRLIELMPHRMHAAWFEDVLLPALAQRLLISPDVLEAFEKRKAELGMQKPQVPPRSRASGKITLNF
jgi:hypothetical protein